jgi:hypothetical protein
MGYADPKKQAAYNREWGAKNRSRIAASKRKRRSLSPEHHRVLEREANKRYSARHPDRVRELKKAAAKRYREKNKTRVRAAQRRYAGLPIPTRPEPTHCEVCKCIPDRRSLCLDHCHQANVFRGWLCNRCNRVLGLLNDDPDLLAALLNYLKGKS